MKNKNVFFGVILALFALVAVPAQAQVCKKPAAVPTRVNPPGVPTRVAPSLPSLGPQCINNGAPAGCGAISTITLDPSETTASLANISFAHDKFMWMNMQGADPFNPDNVYVNSTTDGSSVSTVEDYNVAFVAMFAGSGTRYVGMSYLLGAFGSPPDVNSTNGTTWSTAGAGTAPAVPIMLLSYLGGKFVALGYGAFGSSNGAVSSDGLTWTPTDVDDTGNYQYMAYGNGVYVATSADGSIIISSDGENWSQPSNYPDFTGAVAFGNGVFVMVESGGSGVATSFDGNTWTNQTPAENNYWSSVAFGNGLFVVVGDVDAGTSPIMTSPDGVTWTTVTADPNMVWADIEYGNGVFVLYGGDNADVILGSMTCSD